MTPDAANSTRPPAPAEPNFAGLPADDPGLTASSPSEPASGGLSAADRDLAMLAACACAAGERLQSAANAGMLAVLASGVYGLIAVPGGARGAPLVTATALASAALAIWAWQTVLAARLALDARVFRAFTRGRAEGLEPVGFDRALARAGLRQGGAPRGMDARWQGARRLLVQQALCVAVLVLMAAAPLVWIGAHA